MQFTGKTVEEAIEKGLKELGIEKKNALITVINEPVKGLFGIIKTMAKVEIIENKTEEQKVEEFVKEIAKFMDFDVSTEVYEKDGSTVIKLNSNDSSNIIGYRGEVLDAIQTLAGASMNIGRVEYKKVVVDCENYRDKREETLISLAKKLEQKATEMRREVILEPMSPYERRIIHTSLANSETCTTKSDGKEPNRYVIIVPNDKDESSTPYNAGRNKGDRKYSRQRKDSRKKSSGFKSRYGKDSKKSGFTEQKRKTTISFGTYLGNSLKDK